MAILNTLKSHLGNIPGWRTDRKIVVIESDDWGTVRMSSPDAYRALLKKGYRVDLCAYNRNDMLESNTDLSRLFEILLSFKDRHGNHPVITANTIVANPDFRKIKESEFLQYDYEVFTETLKRYPDHENVLSLYKRGIEMNIFRPQFHGREHVNINNWLSALRKGDQAAQDAFEFGMFSVHRKGSFSGVASCKSEFLDAFGGYSPDHVAQLRAIVNDGLNLFEQLWGYKSRTFIAPCYVWPDGLETTLSEREVHSIQGIRVQMQPDPNSRYGYKSRYRYLGKRNQLGQRSIVRNVFFEPSELSGNDIVDNCLKQIYTSFQWNKPAIICAHRMNFVGGINPLNRDKNLAMFRALLKDILAKFPDVEFRSSEFLWD